MINKKISLTILSIILCCAVVLAIPKPDQPADPFSTSEYETLSVSGESQSLPALDISASPNSLMGSECTNLYASTGDYCSGHVRIYYQCLPTLYGSEWQQRNENCEDYEGRCIEEDGRAKCVDYPGSTSHGKKMLFIGIALIVIGVLAGIFAHPIFFLLCILGIWMIIKMYLGGV